MPLTTGAAHESESTQIVFPVMFSERSRSRSRSVGLPWPARIRSMILGPRGAFTALRALRARLVRVEARQAHDLVNHIRRVIEHDHAARAEHRASLHDPLVVE